VSTRRSYFSPVLRYRTDKQTSSTGTDGICVWFLRDRVILLGRYLAQLRGDKLNRWVTHGRQDDIDDFETSPGGSRRWKI